MSPLLEVAKIAITQLSLGLKLRVLLCAMADTYAYPCAYAYT